MISILTKHRETETVNLPICNLKNQENVNSSSKTCYLQDWVNNVMNKHNKILDDFLWDSKNALLVFFRESLINLRGRCDQTVDELKLPIKWWVKLKSDE